MGLYATAETDAFKPGAGAAVLTVAAVVGRIKQSVEGSFPSAVWVEGQLQDCKYHTSGHIYFTLVDEKGTDRFGNKLVINAAFFKGANASLKFKLADGLKVLALGQITTYESRSQYQLRVMRMEPQGVGSLQLAFEQMKQRLQAEGLFDPERKRPIPRWPGRVALITSRTGSVVHDMATKLKAYFDLVVVPVKVQGEGAALEISAAIDTVNALKLAEVLIVGRGGGSVEDLWAFNEEPVARAIVRSAIPVISAVGHQDDWTIADYVADMRASTPTDAAKHLVNERQLLADQGQEAIERLVEGMRLYLDEQDTAVTGLARQLQLLHPSRLLDDYLRRTAQARAQLGQVIRFVLEREERRISALAGRLDALSPLAVLGRGYSITFDKASRAVVTDPASVAAGDQLETLVQGGKIWSTVTGAEASAADGKGDPDGRD